MCRILVCGGRSFGEVPDGCPPDQIAQHAERAGREVFLLRQVLDQQITERKATHVITGGARGADQHAARRALWRGIKVEVYKADWRKDGKKAGPIRNARMLQEGKPDLVLAFSGGRGTADMVLRAKAAGVEVIEV